MKKLTELLTEGLIKKLATPSDYRLGKEIFRQGGVEIIEVGTYMVVARSKPRNGQKRSVTLTATEDGLACRCT